MSLELIPVVLFVYRRPEPLKRTLDGLRANAIPLLIVYCDGLRDPADAERVAEVRRLVREIDWCPTRIVERDKNLGLGISIRTGVSEALDEFGAVVVFEDDIDCVPGSYDYMVAALRQYKDDPRVMSVGAFTHPDVCPSELGNHPYFDARFTCWGWGTWRRAWEGMSTPAKALLLQCRLLGKSPDRYGHDIAIWAGKEAKMNIWAVRFLLLHLRKDGLCFHPPHSLTNHEGFDESSTSTGLQDVWKLPVLETCPPLPDAWPEPIEHPAVQDLYQAKCGAPVSLLSRLYRKGLMLKWRFGAWLRALRAKGAARD